MHPDAHLAPTKDRRRWLAMIPMLLGIVIGAVTISSATTALPSMSLDLGLSAAEAIWIIDVYPLALAVSLVVAARAGDRFGRCRMMLIGLLGFAVFSLLGGFSGNGLTLIAARALLGTSEALVIASVVATIGVQFQARERVLAYGLWTAAFGAGSAFGPLVGGFLADGPGWRWILFGATPVAGAAMILAATIVPESRTSRPPHWDLASIFLSVLALAGIVYAMQHAVTEPLPSFAAGVAGALALILFSRRQLRLADPLIDVRLFRNTQFSNAYARIIIATGTSAATVYLVSVHLQQERGTTAIEAGLVLLPHAVMIVLGGILAPLTLRALPNRVITAIALLVQAVGLAWAASDPESFLAPLLLVGLGMGIVGTLTATALFDVTTSEEAGQVGAIQEVGFALGAGLGVAVFGALAIMFMADGFTVALLCAATGAVIASLAPGVRLRRRPRSCVESAC